MPERHHDDETAAGQLESLRAAVSAIESGSTVPALRDARPLRGLPPQDPEVAQRPSRRVPPPDPQGPQADAEADEHAVARAVVLRQLTGAPKSRKQLQDALTRKGCPPDVASEVLDRFEEVGLVDDEAYAQALVRSQQAGRGLARRALSHELRKRGVDEELAASVLEGVDPEAERARAHELVAKKLRTMHGLDRATQTRRLAGLLARKGYGHDVARMVITEALDSQPEHQRD